MRVLGGLRNRRFIARRLLAAGGALILSGVLISSLLFPFLSVHAEEVDGPWTYEIDAGKAVLLDYDFGIGATDVTIPASLGGAPVEAIPDNLFSNSEDITSVVIPGSVKTIGVSAFSFATNLSSVTLGQGVEVIDGLAFWSTPLTSITIPDSVTTINVQAFGGTAITSAFVPNSVTSLGYSPFYDSQVETLQIGTSDYVGEPLLDVGSLVNMPQLKHLSFGNNVLSIGAGGGIYTTPLLETIDFGGSVRTITSIDPASSNLDTVTIPDSVTSITQSFNSSTLQLTSIVIPDSVVSLGSNVFSNLTATNIYIGTSTFTGEPTMTINSSSFNDITATNVVIGNSVKTINNGAFYNSSGHIEHIDFGDSVQTIGTAFTTLTGLTEVNLPDSLISISGSAFSNNPDLETVVIGTSDYQGSAGLVIQSAFNNNPSLMTVTIGNVALEITGGAFFDNPNLTTISIGTLGYTGTPELIINSGALGTLPALQTLVLGNNVKSIINGSFSSLPALTSLSLGESIEEIGSSSFSSLPTLPSLALPDSIQTIAGGTFNGMTALETVSIGTENYSGPATLSIDGLFNGASNLKNIYFGHKVKEISGFSGATSLVELTIPDSVDAINSGFSGLTALEKLTIGTENYSGEPNLVIQGSSFSGLSALTELNLGNNLKEVKFGALAYAPLLEHLAIPNSVETISTGALSGLTNLQSLTIGTSDYSGPARLTIMDGAFGSLSSLSTLTLNNTVKDIRNSAFGGSTQLTSLSFPDSLEFIGYSAFSGALAQVSSITIGTPQYSGPAKLIIEAGAFVGAPLTSLTMHNTVKKIESGAFSGNLLTDVVIPDSVETLNGGSFQGSAIKSITLGSSLTSIYYAFPGVPVETITVRGTGLTMQAISEGIQTLTPSYVQLYTSDPSNPAGLTDLVVREDTDGNSNGYLDIQRVFLVNPAQVTVQYRDANGNALLPSTPVSIGAADSYAITDFENDHLGDFYRAGTEFTSTAPAVDGYITPAARTVALQPGLNTVVFTYYPPIPSGDDDTTPVSQNQNTRTNIREESTENLDESDAPDQPATSEGPRGSGNTNGGVETDKGTAQDDADEGTDAIVTGVAIAGGAAVAGTTVALAAFAIRRKKQ